MPAAATTPVDLELVLAVDVSMSMDLDEQRLQRNGYVRAMRDPDVIKAITSGPHGRIAVTYVEWAGNGIQKVVVPWRTLAEPAHARQFADELAGQQISRARRTSISSAILYASTLFGKDGRQGLRRVIDVSGDGPNNAGIPIMMAREQVLKKGIIINGLAIQLKQSGFARFSYFDLENLDTYYKDCVIGGPGSFALSIRKTEEFATAIRQKLLLEIAGSQPARGHGLIVKAQFTAQPPRVDCEVGEKRWRQFWQDQE